MQCICNICLTLFVIITTVVNSAVFVLLVIITTVVNSAVFVLLATDLEILFVFEYCHKHQ